MGCNEPDPPTLYCQSSEDEFGWIQVACSQVSPTHLRWIVTFGISLLKSDVDVNEFVSQILGASDYQLERSQVSSTLLIDSDLPADELAAFVVALISTNSRMRDLNKVEVVLEYR